ncbi:MAG: hypothetical protein K2Q34_06250 [Alphaproteobacteria bacterium]|nr:hypothetical protein [Alphaproteobacteria bacterium]
MGRLVIFLSFLALWSNACYATPKYQAAQIIEEIKKSKDDSYLKDGLLITELLFSEIKKNNEKVIEKFKKEIQIIDDIIERDSSDLVYNWVARYYPKNNIVCIRRSKRAKS